MAMEAAGLDYQSMSACKQIRMMGRRSFPSSENIAPHINYVYGSGGLLQAPLPPHLLNLYRQLQLQQQQPPLLPLPVASSKPLHQSLPYRTRSQSLTPKKPKSKRSNLKKQQQKDMNNSISSGGIIMASTTRLGPDPSDLPKDVTKVLSSSSSSLSSSSSVGVDMDNFSSSIFTLAPPPSSLPLPRFSSLKQQPRLGCKAAAAGGVDAGATDNLCRLLRLR